MASVHRVGAFLNCIVLFVYSRTFIPRQLSVLRACPLSFHFVLMTLVFRKFSLFQIYLLPFIFYPKLSRQLVIYESNQKCTVLENLRSSIPLANFVCRNNEQQVCTTIGIDLYKYLVFIYNLPMMEM